jgi:hypothetical protein
MKAWSVVGLLLAAAIFASIPISPQVTPRGLELGVDEANAVTYGHYRRVHRRVYRRAYHYWGAPSYYYGAPSYYGLFPNYYGRRWLGP